MHVATIASTIQTMQIVCLSVCLSTPAAANDWMFCPIRHQYDFETKKRLKSITTNVLHIHKTADNTEKQKARSTGSW